MATTNSSQSDQATIQQYKKAGISGDPNPPVILTSELKNLPTAGQTLKNSNVNNADTVNKSGGTGTSDGKVAAGGIPKTSADPVINFKNSQGQQIGNDMRVRILVPNFYIRNLTKGPNSELLNIKGIIFPYTPQIQYEHKADYSAVNPIHSNFTINFYKNSSIGPISISGKFSVQNANDADVYLATIHLLRSLTKMRSGMEQDSGAPPPVCRLYAWGDFMLNNVPVVISTFRVELPDGVDYYQLGNTKNSSIYGKTAVPTISTIAVTCIPMYSKAEMQKFTVNNWLGTGSSRKSGYL